MEKIKIYPQIIDEYQSSEIAEQENLKEDWMGAKYWFENVVESDDEFELDNMPKYNRFICHMDYINSDLYYDYGAGYYFAVLNQLKTENMKRTIRLTESDLHRIIKESVKTILNEESDITIVNDESDGKPYMVRIWSGSGYLLPAFKAYANNEQDALEHVVAYLDNEGENYLFADKEYSQAYAEAEQEGDEEELELLDDIFYYVDATMYGASTPHFVRTENLQVYPYKFGNK